jgi:pyruvate,water dikinase
MTTIAFNTAGAGPDLVPIRPFLELSSTDVPYAGAKGANLGELTRTGLPVPPGFVVGAPACAAFQEADGDSEMPGWLADAIGAAYDELCDGELDAPVAVRSSATAEDTASASSTEMNETFFNVRGRDAVIDAVTRCSQSLLGAVVVQRQIPSTRAGVMFTIDPATNDRDHLVIEGSFGLGELVASGQVSPDRYVVEKSNMTVVGRSVRPKEFTIEMAPDGGTVKRELSTQEGRCPVLSDEEVLRLAELGVAIEREYGVPQHTEWAFDHEGNIWMLQSRPIPTRGDR